MLDQLVESRDAGKENKRREGFLLTTFLGTASLFTAALVYSLFSSNLAMGSDRLEISDLIAPVNIAESEPPAPEPQTIREKPAASDTSKSLVPVRNANIQRADESPVKAPDAISAVPNTQLSRPNAPFKIGPVESDPSVTGGLLNARNTGSGDAPAGVKPVTGSSEEIEKDAPPVIKKPEPKPEPQKTVTQTGGVLNGKAINLVKPAYPAAAKAVRAYGAVNVQVLIDEEGNVVSAKAVSGPALLQDAAVRAARQSKFSPTYLSKQKVKVTGVIVYNFTAQ